MPTYDLAVAGAGLGGLAAAALMSSRGNKVALIECGPSFDEALGVRDFEGFTFFSGPSLSYGFEHGGAVRNYFAELGHEPENGFGPVVAYQVALPDRRITVSGNEEETFDELRREFPREIESVRKFYRDLKKEAATLSKSRLARFFANHTSAAGFLKKYKFSPELTRYFDIQSRYFYHFPITDISLAALALFCGTMPVRFPRGSASFAEHFLSIVRSNGGDLRFGAKQAEIGFHRSRVAEISLDREVINARTVLLSADSRVAPVHCLGISDSVVPVGMARDVLYLPDYAQPDEFFVLSLCGRDDHASAPQGRRALTVTMSSKNADQRTIAESISRIVPFLEENTVVSKFAEPARPSFRLPEGAPFKNVWPDMLSRSPRRNLYMLHEQSRPPIILLPTVQKFVKHIA